MAANRKVGWLAFVTGLGLALVLLVFAGLPGGGLPPKPERDVDPDRAAEIPGVIANDAKLPVPETVSEKPPAAPRLNPKERRVPLEVAVIDGETGLALDVAPPRLEHGKDRTLTLQMAGEVWVHPEITFRASGMIHVWAWLDLPDGYALEEPGRQFQQGIVSLYAERIRVTFPAWRHAPIHVRVTDSAANPVAGARVMGVSLSGKSRRFTADSTDADGWTRVHGIPALHGERILIQARTSERHESAACVVVDSATPIRVVVVLPEEPNNHLIGVGGGAGEPFSGHRDNFRRAKESGTASLSVMARHRDGRPAVDTMVVVTGDGFKRFSLTDEHGRVRFTELVAGDARVLVTEPGFVMGDQVPVTLAVGTESHVEVFEAPERWVTGIALDENGRALPSARVEIRRGNRPPLIFLDRGLQHLHPLTGPDGRFAFPNVPPGEVKVGIAYGTRSAQAVAADAGVATVRFLPEK